MSRWSTCEECENVLKWFQLSDRKEGRVVGDGQFDPTYLSNGPIERRMKILLPLSLFSYKIFSLQKMTSLQFNLFIHVPIVAKLQSFQPYKSEFLRLNLQSTIVYFRYEQLDSYGIMLGSIWCLLMMNRSSNHAKSYRERSLEALIQMRL